MRQDETKELFNINGKITEPSTSVPTIFSYMHRRKLIRNQLQIYKHVIESKAVGRE